MYKDKDRQKEANRLAASKRRAKGMTKGMTNQGMTNQNSNTLRPEPVKRTLTATTITDACGTEHAIDYEGRCKDLERLESWAEGGGTEHQRSMGKLARNYRVVDIGRYLGNEPAKRNGQGQELSETEGRI